MKSFFSYMRTKQFAAGTVAGVMLCTIITSAGAAMRGSAIFDDVKSGSYYDEAIGELYGDGVITGYESGDFGPDDFVTRGQVAVMLKRFRDTLGDVEVRSSSSKTSRSLSSGASTSSTSSSSSVDISSFTKGAFRFTTSTFTTSESKRNYTVSVIRSGSANDEASVEVTLKGVTATGGSDFADMTNTLFFDNGETSKTVTITVKDDQTGEGTETLEIVLQNPSSGAGIASPGTAVLSILDDEQGGGSSAGASSAISATNSSAGTFSFKATGYHVDEDTGTVTITVLREGGSSSTATVAYATKNGTATSGTNYTATTGTLSFGNGETSKTFTVPVTDNVTIDGAKTFNVSLSSPTGGAGILNGSTDVTVNDDETLTFGSGSIKFSKSTYSVTEATGEIVVTVQRVGGASGSASVTYATRSGTASTGSDFTAINGTLTFESYESSKTLRIKIIKDDDSDSGEEFYMDLNAVGSEKLISPYTTTLKID